MRLFTVCIWSLLILLVSIVDGKGGAPILIKSEGKKHGKGKELIMLGGGCSPVLIKNGGDKKGKKHSQMIIAGGGDCGEKRVKIIKIPHYVPFVVHKLHVVPKVIYKHHYVKVPHIVVRRVPVPVHVPQYVPIIQKEVHMMYDQYNKQRRRSYKYH